MKLRRADSTTPAGSVPAGVYSSAATLTAAADGAARASTAADAATGTAAGVVSRATCKESCCTQYSDQRYGFHCFVCPFVALTSAGEIRARLSRREKFYRFGRRGGSTPGCTRAVGKAREQRLGAFFRGTILPGENELRL